MTNRAREALSLFGVLHLRTWWGKLLYLRLLAGCAVVAVAACGNSADLSGRNAGGGSANYSHVVFATMGDANTSIDLSSESPGSFSLVNDPTTMTLDGSVIEISHTNAIHELAIVADGRSGKITHVWNTTQPKEGPAYPLVLSDDGRWIVDAKGYAFQANGDAPWSIFAQLDREDATLYYADRANMGVNLLLGRMIEHKFSDNDPVMANRYGHLPFVSRLNGGSTADQPDTLAVLAARIGVGRARMHADFTSPNETYWEHVDWLIREAYRYGMVVIAFPAYIGYLNGDQGWTESLIANGVDGMSVYGEFIGRRYKGYPNIIWGFGGDAVLADEAAPHDAMALSVKHVDEIHLATAKSARNRSSLDDYDEPWLDINAVYSSHDRVAQEIARGWAQRPVMPVFLIEGRYGNEHGMSSQDLRRQMWQAICSGGFGHVYGNAPTWYFGTTASASANAFADIGGLNWKRELENFGATSLRRVSKLLSARDISIMTPDHVHGFILSDAAWGIANDRSLIAYADGSVETITIDQSRFLPGFYDVKWLDPDGGSIVDGGRVRFGEDGTLYLSLPDPHDWVLIVDRQLTEFPLHF